MHGPKRRKMHAVAVKIFAQQNVPSTYQYGTSHILPTTSITPHHTKNLNKGDREKKREKGEEGGREGREGERRRMEERIGKERGR